MKRLTLPKHQKLILQCYPYGNSTDKRPNASELSYLLYYASTRRAKLSKVGAFLEKKNSSDLYKGRSGNVDVTLDIIKALIDRCHEDLVLFADHVIAILYQVLQSKDLEMCQHCYKVFDVFCIRHDGNLFARDSKYSSSFVQLVEKFIEVSDTSTGPNVVQWKTLGMQAAKSIASSEIVVTQRGEDLVRILIPHVLNSLTLDEDGTLLLDVKSKLDKQDAQKREISGRPSMSGTGEGQEAEANLEDILQLTSADALRTFYDAVGGSSLRVTLKATAKFILNKRPAQKWSETLIKVVTMWTPVQLRFAVVSVMVDILVTLKSDNLKDQNAMALLIGSLLSSNVSMVGLSVMDVLRSLTSQQHKSIRDGSEGSQQLVSALRDCIAAIAMHIHYTEQVSNMVGEILLKCRHEGPTRQNSGTNLPNVGTKTTTTSSSNSSTSVETLVSDFKNVEAILKVSSAEQSAADNQMNKVPLHVWEGTQFILLHENRDVREAYAHAFLTYLYNAVAENDTNLKLHKHFKVTHGTIGRIALKLYLAAIDRSATKNDYIMIAHILVGMIKNLGVNAVSRILPFTLMMQDVGLNIEHEKSSIYHLEQGVALNSIALLVFDAIADLLKIEELKGVVDRFCQSRTKNGTWYRALDLPLKLRLSEDLEQKRLLEFVPVDSKQTNKSANITREELMEMVSIKDFPSDMFHILFDEASIMDDSSAPTDTATDSVQNEVVITQARSLRQLRGNNNHNGYSPTTHSQEHNASNGHLGLRDFSPRVSDLKRVASGILRPDANGFMRSNRARSESVVSSAMSMQTYNTAAEEDRTIHIPKHEFNDKLDDMTSFLNDMNMQSINERGRLV